MEHARSKAQRNRKIDPLGTHAKSIHYDKRNPQGLCKVHSTENSENAADTTAAPAFLARSLA
ncbi:MAG: hypothetical protein DME81_04360 [Verrucomicrobia bacterium]|nr:MAG: hypothetical protein DME81_04360 [Verrucomicrobiota bacterium]